VEYADEARQNPADRRRRSQRSTGCRNIPHRIRLDRFGWRLACISYLSPRLVYLYYERLMAFRRFDDFRSERLLHECIACGACCHLKVNVGKDDVERILKHLREKGLNKVVIEKRGSRYWLKRESGECCFLAYSEDRPRCQIYPIRPVACRLYPLIPTGERLKADPLCPGFNSTRGQTFKEFLRTQEVGAYVRRTIGKI